LFISNVLSGTVVRVNLQISGAGVSDAEVMYQVAQTYALLGDKNSALLLLRHSIDNGFSCYPYFVRDPLLDPLRSEPQFSQLLHDARHRHEEFQRNLS
jgi:hypothetical protein